MNDIGIRIDLLPNQFLRKDGKFDKEEAIKFSGRIAGVCYDKEGFNHLLNEDEEVTLKRANMTLNNGHHSVFDHVWISFNIQNIPKILAMVINNEHEYTTSEKSARYTPVVRTDFSIITDEEERLYNKWLEIFKKKIKERYGNVFTDSKIKKLAQENARYLVTVFMPTQMIYTTSLRQINYIASWMGKYMCQVAGKKGTFEKKLIVSMSEFIAELERLNVLIPGLMQNEKDRSLSLLYSSIKNDEFENKKTNVTGKKISASYVDEYFNQVYMTQYKASFACLAQAQRHRTLDYQMEILDEKEYFIPPIIMDDVNLVNEWLSDMNVVKDVNPQGELVRIKESGKYEDFILKCKERLCSEAQLEIMMQTRATLLRYKKALEDTNSPLAEDIAMYSHGARCTFPDFKCSKDCKFSEGKLLTRKI